MSMIIAGDKKREMAITYPFRIRKHPAERTRCQQPHVTGKRMGRRRHQHPDQGVSRARPLARRALSTCRPLLVAIRARKPCVRLRLITLG